MGKKKMDDAAAARIRAKNTDPGFTKRASEAAKRNQQFGGGGSGSGSGGGSSSGGGSGGGSGGNSSNSGSGSKQEKK